MTISGMKLLLSSAAIALLANSALAKPYNRAALIDVLGRVKASAQTGRQPIVLFDLDDTLINTRERNLRILKDFARSPDFQAEHPAEAAKILALRLADIKYQSGDTLKGIGITDESVLKAAADFWLARFFTNEYCAEDVTNAGAAKYLQILVRARAKVVYLTGRDVPRMHDGTVSNLTRNRFPVTGSQAELLMKPDPKMDDLQFKKDSFEHVASEGDVVGVFENEPANLNAMAERFPEATAIFLDTIRSPKPDVPTDNAEWVPDFQLK